MFAPLRTFDAGEQLMDAWIKQVVAPAAAPPAEQAVDSAAFRVGDSIVLAIPEWVDTRGHWGYAALPADTSSFELYEDDELVGSGPRADGTFAVGPGPSEYRIELDVERNIDGWIYSSNTSTVWTVQSETTAQPETLPLLNIDYRPRLDMLEQERPRKAGLIRWDVEAQPGSAASPITGSQLWVSYDDGDTWTEVEGVQEPVDGRFRVRLPDAPAGAATVSLRIAAADDAGGAVWQEVVPAYALFTE
jgi:hypothetical protein